jgi:hypothetical protein
MWSRTQVFGFNNYALDWSTVQGPGGPIGMLDGSAHDELYYAHYITSGSLVYLDAYARTATQLLAGGVMDVPLAGVTTLTPNKCIHVTAAGTAELARLDALVPGTGGGFLFWAAYASPDPEFAGLIALPLAYVGYITTDIDELAMYANPYPGHEVDVEVVDDVMDNAAGYEVASAVPAPADCSAAIDVPVAVVAIPHDVTVGTTLIPNTNDVHPVLDLTAPVPISWQLTAGTSDLQFVKLQEYVNYVWVDRIAITTTRAQTTIDPGQLVPGHSYRLVVNTLLGYPMAASGDFSTFTHATTRATYVSPTFKP